MLNTICYKSPQHRELVYTVRCRIDNGEKYLHIAESNNVSAALVRKVYLFGVDSKKLRKAMDIIGPPRHRLNIDCPPELKAIFYEMCDEYELTPPELQQDMMRVYNDTMENMPY